MAPEHRHDAIVPSAPPIAQLGNYELLRQIAVGEFCSVHRARSMLAATHEQVALKRLRGAHQDAYGRARLLREARVGLALHSPQLVRVIEVCDQPEPFLVMEYVPGATLRELLVRSGKIDALPFIAPIIVDVLRALSALHDHRDAQGEPRPLVHQSPSARHMLVGEDGVTRLLDLSDVHRHGLGATREVGQRFLRGELAPEQLESRAVVDVRCDLFIVGKALSEALTRASAVRVARDGEAQVRSRCAGVFAIAERACAERREERFRSADQLACALQEAAEEAALFAAPAQLAEWVQRVCGASVPPLAPPLLGQVPARAQPAPAEPAPKTVLPPVSRVTTRAIPPPPPPTPVVSACAAPARVAEVIVPAFAPVPAFARIPDRGATPPPAPTPVASALTPVSTPATPIAPARESTVAPEPTPVPARASGTYLVGSSTRLGSVVGVAGIVALLTSLFTLSVRGLQHTPPTVGAARLLPEHTPAPASAAPDTRTPAPVISPLAAPRKRAHLQRAARAELAPSPAPELGQLPADRSTIETIAESIRAAQARRGIAGSAVRPRKLRLELPDNPY